MTAEDVLAVCHAERPVGVIVQFGGQTPLKLARTLEEEGFPVLGTAPEAIDLAEDRGKFAQILAELDIAAPPHGEARTMPEARAIAAQIGFPVVVRPSYVLGGRAMEIVYDADDLETFVRTAAEASPDHPVLIDRFLEGAIEVDVDAVSDGSDVFIGAVMEHIEEAGVHSGDSSCQIPPATLSDEELDEIEDITRRLARRLGVVGLLNLQLAVKDERIWVLEANPRASRTVPFVSKAIGVSLARIATLVLTGRSLAELARRRRAARRSAPLPAPAVHQREGRRAAVRTVPGRRHGARARDEVDRRGHGDRRATRAWRSRRRWSSTGTGLPTSGTVFV